MNTDKDIIKVGDLYYMCFQGVWFMGSAPNGPWEVTGSVPSAIYEIPVSSPAYPVTYVTVQSSTSDAVVFASAMAYTGLMVAWGCAVWGTGYYYPPYVHYGAFPVYYPHYPTYGYAASYNPWTGAYSRGAVAYGPYGGAGVGARYNPTTGTYSRGAAAYGPYGGAAAGQAYNPRTGTYARGGMAYGPYGAQGAAQAYNPRTGAYGATRQGSNVYGNWGASEVQRGDQWATTSHATNYATGTTTRTAQGSEGGAAVSRSGPIGTSFAGQSQSGDMYAGHDGNVYKNEGGGWQKYDNGSWNSVQRPSSDTMSQLNSDRAARSEGSWRSNEFSGIEKQRCMGFGQLPVRGRRLPPTLIWMYALAILLVPSGARAQPDTQLWGEFTLQWIKTHRITYAVDFEPKVLIWAPAGDPGWYAIDVTPKFDYTLNSWATVGSEFLVGWTKQDNDVNTLEITPRVDLLVHLLGNILDEVKKEKRPKRRVVLGDLVRLEFRNLYYSDDTPKAFTLRLRNRVRNAGRIDSSSDYRQRRDLCGSPTLSGSGRSTIPKSGTRARKDFEPG